MSEKALTFEEALARLDSIVRQLEKGDAPLDQALALFEEGTNLIGRCTKMLDEAEQKVVQLKKGPDGEPVELPFDSEEC
ncbi:MAG: exodeoxyribonuclease VII small subunit [Oscillospiraceae bacterium]|jgi:exodeoxyribonuclease VII small subunit